MTAPERLLYGELGSWATGVVLDPQSWTKVAPQRKARGTVVTIYPQARNVVDVRTDDGEQLTIQLAYRSAK